MGDEGGGDLSVKLIGSMRKWPGRTVLVEYPKDESEDLIEQ